MVDRQKPGRQRQLGPMEHRARGQAGLALAAVALVDRAALEFGIAAMPATRAGPAPAPAQAEQRRPALRLGPEALPELGLAQALNPPPQPALRAHPLAPQRPKHAQMLTRRRMGVTDNQVPVWPAQINDPRPKGRGILSSLPHDRRKRRGMRPGEIKKYKS